MKASYERIASQQGNESFVAYSFSVPSFKFKWHYHPEYELTLITRGKGERLVGDSNERFIAGDLVLIGSELPHTWYSEENKNEMASAVVIQFTKEFMEVFLRLQGFEKIAKLLTAASHGLFFPKAKEIAKQIECLPQASGVEKVTLLLTILQQLTSQKSIVLSSAYFNAVKSEETEKRINKVCQYIHKHSSQPVDLNTIASLIHLSPSAFCKFFKRATGKTFSDYVNDIRIGNACQMLTESDKAISTIAYETGFESLTYFNRVFIKKKGVTPRGFRTAIRSRKTK